MTDDPDAAAPKHSGHWTARRFLAVGLVLAVLAGVSWWSTHPHRFAAVGNKVGVGAAALDKPVLFGMLADPGGDGVVLRGAKARIRVNTAAADIRVVLCRGRQGESPVGTVQASADAFCSSLLSLHGTRLRRLSSGTSSQLLVEVTARRPGRVLIDGIDISYSTGLQRGSQATGIVLDVATAVRG